MGLIALMLAALAGCSVLGHPSTGPVAARMRAPSDAVRPGSQPSACAAAGSVPDLDSIGAETGKQPACALVFANQTATWSQWERPWFLDTPYADQQWAGWADAQPGRRLILSLGMAPTGVPPDWRQLGAAGEYDGYAAELGHTLVDAGLGDSYIELGAEANVRQTSVSSAGTSLGDLRAWASMWAQTAEAMRVSGSHFVFVWTVNAGYRDVPFADYYPGDAAVDVIGIDQYDSLVDQQPVRDGERRWDLLRTQPGGLDDLERFAASHHKRIAFPEWGLDASLTPGGGGDDADYVKHMASVFRTQPVAFESLFDVVNPGILRLDEAPQALAVYREQVLGEARGTRRG